MYGERYHMIVMVFMYEYYSCHYGGMHVGMYVCMHGESYQMILIATYYVCM